MPARRGRRRTRPSQAFVGLALTSHTTTELNTSSFTSVTVSTAPSAVQSTVVDTGATQRSMVRSFTVALLRPVASFDTGAFTLTRRDGGAGTAVPYLAAVAPDGMSIALTMPDGGSFADGVYDVLVSPAMIRDAAGQAASGTAASYSFHRLYGDINGDRVVGGTDYFQFSKAYGKTTPDPVLLDAFDYDASGSIGGTDYFQFRKRYGQPALAQ